jgi:GNAT superfamily N-acetyltransferase
MTSLRSRLDGVLVCTRSDLSALPAPSLPPGVTMRELDLNDAEDSSTWLSVHNPAFDHTWTRREVQRAMLDHDHIAVTRTFLLSTDDRPAAVASIGHFRRAPQIGVGHYLAVLPSMQHAGLGRAITVHRYNVLRGEGFRACESQTHIGRVASLRLHFDCGFTPKRGLDAWNNPDTWSTPERAVADLRLYWLHRRWKRAHDRR